MRKLSKFVICHFIKEIKSQKIAWPYKIRFQFNCLKNMEPQQQDQPLQTQQPNQTLQVLGEKTIVQGAEQKKEITGEEQVDDDGVIIDPYTISNKTGKDIDYTKIIHKFNCSPLTGQLVQRIEKLTGQKAHHYIRRGIFFAHRELDLILNAYEKHTNPDLPPFYLYTGRGPSSQALHLGHLLPFIFNKYLQEAFKVPFVIQITDDEKYFHKQGGDLVDFHKLAIENLKDIIAIGLDPQYTFIFIDSQYMGTLYPNVCRFQKHINMSTLKAIFGLQFSDNCGKAAYPAIQAAPCLSSSFPHIFGNKNIPCLIPCGIDQDPYFRMTRDVCPKLKAPKPAGFYSKFFPSLQGFGTKMSASDPNTGIFLTDTPKQIDKKIKMAFSGGKATKEEQQKYGADIQIDIPYNYLRFFLQDDKQLAQIGEKYSSGKMLTGEIKKILIKIIQNFVKQHQERRAKITDQDIKKFMSTAQRKYKFQKKI